MTRELLIETMAKTIYQEDVALTEDFRAEDWFDLLDRSPHFKKAEAALAAIEAAGYVVVPRPSGAEVTEPTEAEARAAYESYYEPWGRKWDTHANLADRKHWRKVARAVREAGR